MATPPSDGIDQEVYALKSTEAKRDFLEEVFKEDQKYRQGQSSQILQTYGKLSKQYQSFMIDSDRNDSLNLAKVESYVKIHGYPNLQTLGELAAQTPWAVIHHANNYEDRLRNFKLLHQAYQDGNIDSGAFSLFLERMYNYKFRQRYVIEGVYDQAEQIEKLIQLLELN